MKNFGYPKEEKLKQKKHITFLFEKGKWKTCGKIRMIIVKTDIPAINELQEKTSEGEKIFHSKAGVSVSKRYFKKAVDRNRIKRLLRESYRLNKNIFKEKFGENYLVMLFWNSPEKPQRFKDVEIEFLNLCKSKK